MSKKLVPIGTIFADLCREWDIPIREPGGLVAARQALDAAKRRLEYGDRTEDCEYKGLPTPDSTEIDGKKWCTCDGCVAFREWWTDLQHGE